MEKTWKATVAGILSIISGTISSLYVIVFIIAIYVINTQQLLSKIVIPEDLPIAVPVMNIMMISFLIVAIDIAVSSIVGGVFALKRKRWGWALAGSIYAIFGVFLLGVLSTIFIAMAKKEFYQPTTR